MMKVYTLRLNTLIFFVSFMTIWGLISHYRQITVNERCSRSLENLNSATSPVASSPVSNKPSDCRQAFTKFVNKAWEENGLSLRELQQLQVDLKEREESEECECDGGFYGPLKTNVKYRRKRELERLEKEHWDEQEPLVMCNAMSPIAYIGSGLTVEPLESVPLSGLSIVDIPSMQGNQEYVIEFVSLKNLGVLKVGLAGKFAEKVGLTGQESGQVKIFTDMNVSDTNDLLKNVIYRSKVYDIDARDIVEVRFRGFTVHLHIHVRRKPFPRLFDVREEDNINKKVTVITKTFMRYGALRAMINSVHEYYPGMTIIVADDSKDIERVTDPNVKQFIMPFAEGWFAGRNLALSQVRTPYFFILDDDMVFTKTTKLEKLVEILEDPNLKIDIASTRVEKEDGIMMKTLFTTSIYERGFSRDGHCINRVYNSRHGYLEEYPECEIADEIPNAFMGRTLEVRSIGFDPMLERVGHYEFMLDALGKLRIVCCKDVRVRHLPIRTPEYEKYRFSDGVGNSKGFGGRALYSIYKNNLKCMSGMRQKGPHYYK
ncbi:beta-1,4 N-acetylgalactosaminyltransferase 1-like [Ptychodera flava]|uniref:beta-1,4 N-acetylgalactosaminyltransferase 1-like n=1 Tax=Ptychodera flava TaxID=63121 RepID=UPI00396A9C3E